MKCPKCDFEIAADSRICENCGAALFAQADPPEGPRLVTALFADIIGFTSLSNEIPQSEISATSRFCLDELAGIAIKHSGIVHKCENNYLVALFGIPVRYEDDPEKAVKASLAMIEAVKKTKSMLTQMFRITVDIGVRIGISSGTSIVRLGGSDEKRTYVVIGDTIGSAGELSALAQPGEVIVAEAVFRASRYLFDFKALPEAIFRGTEKLAKVFKLWREKTAPDSKHGVKGFCSPLIGREGDLELFYDKVLALQKGKGGMGLVLGEPGVGKSRLWTELKAQINRRPSPITVFESSCLSYGTAMPYWPFIQILQTIFNVQDTDGPEVIKDKLLKKTRALFPDGWDRIVPYIGYLFSVRFEDELDEKVRHLEPQDLRLQILLSIRDLLLALAKHQPLLIVIDDYQWTDHASLELLEFILNNPAGSEVAESFLPMLVVGLARIEKDREFWPSKQRIQASLDKHFWEITLLPFDYESSDKLIRNLLTLYEMPEEFKNEIIDRAGGNPYYLEEILRSLVDRKIIACDLGIWNLTKDISGIEIPNTIQTVILSRADRLAKEERDVLERASVIGRLFFEPVLVGLTGIDHLALNMHLACLEDLEYITLSKKGSQSEYIFKHPLIQEVIYDSLPRERLVELHRQVALSIEKVFANSISNFTELLSYQYFMAEDWVKAYDYSMRSAKKAKETFLSKDALRFYDRALNSIRVSEQADRQTLVRKAMQTIKEKVEVMHLIGENEPALAEIKKGLFIAEKIGDKRARADYLFLMSDVYGAISAYDQMLTSSKESYAIYQEINDLRGQAESLNNVGVVYDNLGNYDQALDHYSQALRIHADINDRKGAAICHNNIGHLHNNLGNYEKALDCYDKALVILENIGDRKGVAIAIDNIGAINGVQGDYAKALEYHHKSLEIKEEIGDRWGETVSLNNIGYIYGVQGDYAKALEHHNRSLKIKGEIDDLWGATGSLNNIASIYSILGDYVTALNYYNQSLSISGKIGYFASKAVSLNGIARLYAAQENFAKARECLIEAQNIVKDSGNKELLRRVAVSFAELEFAEYAQSITSILRRAKELSIEVIVAKKMITITDLELIGNRQLELDDARRHLHEAHGHTETSFSLAEELKVKSRRAEALILQARVDLADANWPRADTRCQEAITIFEELHQPLELAKAYFYYAEALGAMGNEPRAKEYLQKAKALFDKIAAKEWQRKIAAL